MCPGPSCDGRGAACLLNAKGPALRRARPSLSPPRRHEGHRGELLALNAREMLHLRGLPCCAGPCPIGQRVES